MQNQTHLGSSAARKLPFLHSVQNIFSFYYQTSTRKTREQWIPTQCSTAKNMTKLFCGLQTTDADGTHSSKSIFSARFMQVLSVCTSMGRTLCVQRFRHESCCWNVRSVWGLFANVVLRNFTHGEIWKFWLSSQQSASQRVWRDVMGQGWVLWLDLVNRNCTLGLRTVGLRAEQLDASIHGYPSVCLASRIERSPYVASWLFLSDLHLSACRRVRRKALYFLFFVWLTPACDVLFFFF